MSKKKPRGPLVHVGVREHAEGGASVFAHQCTAKEQLAEMIAHRGVIEVEIGQAVAHLRDEHRVPWEEIATVLGVTRQAVQKRYGTVGL